MNVKILGTGCSNCLQLEKIAREVATDSGIEAGFEKVTDYPSIMGYGVMSTPALVINGAVKSSGRIPSKAEIAGWLREAATESAARAAPA